jgi:DNA-binding NarL/FixJ family response regulator
MGGLAALQELLAIDGAVRALVSSGYSEDPIMAAHASYGFAGVLAKPYTADGLVQAIEIAASPRAQGTVGRAHRPPASALN